MANSRWNANIIKYLLFRFNFVFFLTGLIPLVLGIFVLRSLKNYDGVLDKIFYIVPALLVAISAVIFLISLLGCIGVIQRSYFITLVFTTLLTAVFILEILAAGAEYHLSKQTDVKLRNSLTKSMKNYATELHSEIFWDELQMNFDCCGINDVTDWENSLNMTSVLPMSCCRPQVGSIGPEVCTVFTSSDWLRKTPCFTLFERYINRFVTILEIASLSLGLVHLVGICFALFITKDMRGREILADL